MRIWFITGVSSGLGRALAETVLAKGDTVIGTLRDPAACPSFEALAPDRAHAVLLDVREDDRVRGIVSDVTARIGPIDVLVNNAGYGLEGAVEEASLAEAHAQFDVNVFGALSVLKAVLPDMRARGSGHILNISSIAGLTSFPGVGIYNGSKFALEGITEALAKEVAPLGIRVTLVEPGAFRTDWAGRSLVHAAHRIEDYDATAGAFRREMAARSGKQMGDPRKAAEAIVAAVEADEPPLHLLLGPDALAAAQAKIDALLADIEKWSSVTRATSFEGP
jgi:NAD(P)-dependent dehydrogenase (short-subunit alcohol dehydrogenase family)